MDATVSSKPVKTWDYERLIWNGSGLTSGETLVAAYLLRLTKTESDENGWVTVSQAGVCKATKIRKRESAAAYLKGLTAKGWAECYQPTENGHYLACQYRIRQPTRAPKTGHGVRAPKTGQKVSENGATKYVVTSIGESDTARASALAPGIDSGEDQKQAPPVPASPQAASPDDAQTAAEWIDEQRQDEQTEALAYGGYATLSEYLDAIGLRRLTPDQYERQQRLDAIRRLQNRRPEYAEAVS